MGPDILWTQDQHDELQRQIEDAFCAHPGELSDPRRVSSSRMGYLGNPNASVWFVAENPSLTQVERAPDPMPNNQWNTSRGNRLFWCVVHENDRISMREGK